MLLQLEHSILLMKDGVGVKEELREERDSWEAMADDFTEKLWNDPVDLGVPPGDLLNVAFWHYAPGSQFLPINISSDIEV